MFIGNQMSMAGMNEREIIFEDFVNPGTRDCERLKKE
jgi:hypothetical protein